MDFCKDEHARPDVTIHQLAKLPPVFGKEGTVSAGNASVSKDAVCVLVERAVILLIATHGLRTAV